MAQVFTPEQLKRVCIVWSEGDGMLRTLTYRPEGTVRTYAPDAIDTRAGTPGKDLTMLSADSTWAEVIALLQQGKRLAVPLSIASQFGSDWEFAI